MIREALEFLQTKWLAGQKPIEIPSGRADKKIFLRRNGTSDQWEDVTVDLPSPALTGFATSLESFVVGLGEYRKILDGAPAVVYVSEAEVTAVIGEGKSRLDRLRMPLTRTSVWEVVESLRNGQRFNQAELLQLLRIKLFGLVDPAVVGKYRVLNWQQSTGMNATQQRTQESLGRSVEAKVQALEDLPEYITIAAQVWLELPAIARPMPVFIDPEPMQNAFRVSVPVKEIDAAEDSAIAELVALLRTSLDDDGDDVVVLAGEPERPEIAKE